MCRSHRWGWQWGGGGGGGAGRGGVKRTGLAVLAGLTGLTYLDLQGYVSITQVCVVVCGVMWGGAGRGAVVGAGGGGQYRRVVGGVEKRASGMEMHTRGAATCPHWPHLPGPTGHCVHHTGVWGVSEEKGVWWCYTTVVCVWGGGVGGRVGVKRTGLAGLAGLTGLTYLDLQGNMSITHVGP
jgi:hypothetical protein